MNCALLIVLRLFLSGPPLELADEVVAEVGGEIITRSEVLLEARLILLERQGARTALAEPSSEFLDQVLEMLINQRLLVQEAQRLGLEQVSLSQRQQLVEEFARFFANEAQMQTFLDRLGLSREELAGILVRHLMVERVKEYRLRSLPAVSEREVEAYYLKNARELGGRRLSEVAEAIRLRLLTERRQRHLTAWLEQLKRQARLRVISPFGARSEAGGQ
jgi:hypothetical protein